MNIKERKVITMTELEEIMTTKKGVVFDASSADVYSFSVDLVCTDVNFEKAIDNGEYLCMVLYVGGSEIQIQPDIIEEIYLNSDEAITIEFTENLPDLEIKFRN